MNPDSNDISLDDILAPLPARPLSFTELGYLGSVQTQASFIASRLNNIRERAKAGYPEHAYDDLVVMIKDISNLKNTLVNWVEERKKGHN